MATRNTRFVIKNSITSGATLPSTNLLRGEPVVNLDQGILFFSGHTGSGDYVNSDNPTSGYFEVGSNLYQLKIRDKITEYAGVTNLSGKFLSGTTTGFQLADISSIQGVDTNTYVTGNTNTVSASNGSNLYTTDLTYVEDPGSTYSLSLEDTFVTGGTLTGSNLVLHRNDGTNTTNIDLSSLDTKDTFVTGNTNVTVANKTTSTYTTELTYAEDPGSTYILTLVDTFVTGGTVSNGSLELITNRAAVNPVTVTGSIIQSITGEQGLTATTSNGSTTIGIQPASVTNGMLTNSSITVTAGNGLSNGGSVSLGGSVTLDVNVDNSTIEISTDTLRVKDDGITEPKLLVTGTTAQDGYVLTYDAGSTGFKWIDQGVLTNDTYVTGFTYTSASNTFTISQNNGASSYTASISSVSGLTVDNLTAGRVVYVGTGGLLTDEAGFTYNDSTNTLSTPSDGSMVVGTGGLVVGSGGSPSTPGTGSVVIHGDLTVFGNAITASTGELYVEDNRITLNYNPTTGTSITSLGSGWEIQDGSGVDGTDVYLRLAHFNDTGFAEYTANTGAANRGLYTSLNDIVIRQATLDDSPDSGAIGKRVLAEDDILDGGTY